MVTKVKDFYGDTIEVFDGATRVYVNAKWANPRKSSLDFSLTPKKARRLAKALKRAAKKAER